MRFNLSISPKLIVEARDAAAKEGVERGRPMPVSQWIQLAIQEKLRRGK